LIIAYFATPPLSRCRHVIRQLYQMPPDYLLILLPPYAITPHVDAAARYMPLFFRRLMFSR